MLSFNNRLKLGDFVFFVCFQYALELPNQCTAAAKHDYLFDVNNYLLLGHQPKTEQQQLLFVVGKRQLARLKTNVDLDTMVGIPLQVYPPSEYHPPPLN